jgi:hypothetical protein
MAEYSKKQLTDGSEGQTTPVSNVPVVPFDMDLYHWDNSEGKPPPIKKVCMSSVHQYWGSERDIELSEDEKALLRCRTIQFTGKFEPVKWSCRTPLPSGRLCPRRDRFKCPFHGPIIARDDQGRPSQTATDEPSTSGETSTQPGAPSSNISEADYNDIEAAVFAAKGLGPPSQQKGKKRKGGNVMSNKHTYLHLGNVGCVSWCIIPLVHQVARRSIPDSLILQLRRTHRGADWSGASSASKP